MPGLSNQKVITIPVPALSALTSNQVVEASLCLDGAKSITIDRAEFVTGFTPASTAAKLATLTPSISGTTVTGGAINLTTAGCSTAGAITAGAAITGANVAAGPSVTVGVKVSAVTAFVEGAGHVNIYYHDNP